jgi:hypothetical protein
MKNRGEERKNRAITTKAKSSWHFLSLILNGGEERKNRAITIYAKSSWHFLSPILIGGEVLSEAKRREAIAFRLL